MRQQAVQVEPEDAGLTHAYEVVTVDMRGAMIGQKARSTRIFRERVGSTVLDLVPILEGCFRMGSSPLEKDRFHREDPQYEVRVSGFWMGQYVVTQAQYEAVMGENPSRFKGANRPVEQVNWHKAMAFCDRLSEQTGRQYRLPSEAEWEYACRAGTTTPFHYGETLSSELANYYCTETYQSEAKGRYRGATTEVGQFPSNEYGLYDMHGNVWEWCFDHWHRDYERAPMDGRAWVTGGNRNRRVVRGGSWDSNPRHCRSACRSYLDPGLDSYNIGFRVVCEVWKNFQRLTVTGDSALSTRGVSSRAPFPSFEWCDEHDPGSVYRERVGRSRSFPSATRCTICRDASTQDGVLPEEPVRSGSAASVCCECNADRAGASDFIPIGSG
jgi:formylglycine-generating enzyme required for sulfatase activity